MDVDKVLVDGIELTKDSSMATLRAAGTSGSREKELRGRKRTTVAERTQSTNSIAHTTKKECETFSL